MEEFYVGDDWMDDDCVSYNRDHTMSRQGEKIMLVLYILSLGCIRDLSLTGDSW